MTARPLISSIVFLFITLIATTTVFAGSSTPQKQKTVVEECTENWRKSSADNTCSNESIVKVLNNRCRITADCNISSGGTGSTWKTVDRDEADQLVNCNGTLKLNNC